MDHGVQWRRDLLAAGVTPDELRRSVRVGKLVALRRGAYVDAAGMPDEPVARHALQVRAAVRHLDQGAVVSHVSAAAVHGIAIWNVALTRVHVTRNRRTGARRTRSLDVHAAPLDPDEIIAVDGVASTSVARTVVDLARTLPFEQAVVIADSALRRGLVRPAQLRAAVDRALRRPGNPQARRVVAFADGRSDNPGESRSRIAIHRAGLPAPQLQWRVPGLRVDADFAWPELGTIGEFDGKVKYGRLLRPGQEPGDVVFAEKVREDAIRAERLHVARWTWAELDAFAPVADRIRRGFP
ncbi:MAG: type IV toxin-antitoxin system AbiEi family antitoxin domain-containing protein [Pseudonocardia sp.]